MTFLLRCMLLTLASFGLAACGVSVMVGLTWWLRRGKRTPEGTAAMRADALLRLRLLPASIAVSVGVFTAVGLWRFESREAHEVLGWTLRGGALFGALFLAMFFTRLWRAHRETVRLLSVWLANATRLELPAVTVPAFRIDTQFPVVAVVGIFRPTLLVDGSVLDACTAEELAAILAHEQGHLRRWDNIRRALFSAAPDLLAWTPAGVTLADAWRVATEEAADDVATEQGEETRIHLADALIRVARLAPPGACLQDSTVDLARLPASALYRGDSVEGRVRRLCAAPVAALRPHKRHGTWALLVGIMTIGFLMQREMHHFIEVVVAALP